METDFDYEAPGFSGTILKEKLISHKDCLEYTKVKEQHITDVNTMMKRVEFDLKGNDDISEKMMQYGRYLLLSSSRQNSVLPTHLQGIWNDNVACRIGWTCDMHLDINTQMNYWLSEAGNLSESHEPLFQWMEKAVIPSGRMSAKMHYGLPGWSADLVSNAWGYTSPYWSNTISPCPTSGIWMASDFYEHYEYTKDIEFLQSRVLPVYQEAVEFFVEYVFKEGAFFSSGPSISPENSFVVDKEVYHFSNGCTYEIVMIRELFEQYIKILALLKIENAIGQRCIDILARLIPFRILEDQTLAEYSHDYPVSDPWHRHTSHLLGVYPYHQITPEKSPALAEAAFNTIQEKLKPYEKWEDTGWARSMLMLYCARLEKGDEALWHISEMQEKLTHPNLLVMHPPTRGAGSFKEVYELDGNTGLSMCIIEMLMQSVDDVIRLLPALPEKWVSGSIKGIKARGNIELSIHWDCLELTEVTLKSPQEQEIWIQYKDKRSHIRLKAHTKVTINFTAQNKINV